jgi:hypothetical protein
LRKLLNDINNFKDCLDEATKLFTKVDTNWANFFKNHHYPVCVNFILGASPTDDPAVHIADPNYLAGFSVLSKPSSMRSTMRDLLSSIEYVMRDTPSLQSLRRSFQEGSLGYTYEVEMNIPDEYFLDWDADFEGQSDQFHGFVHKSSIPAVSFCYKYWDDSPGQSGERFYCVLSNKIGSDKKASLALLKCGIHGIRYLDGDSRSKQEGYHNYVMFDGNDVKTILHRNTDKHGQQDLFAEEHMVIPARR